MKTKQVILSLLLTATAIFGQGCVVAAVGLGAAGTIAYVRGDLESTEANNIKDVYSAALEAVNQLDLNLISKSEDLLSANITARDADDKKITIKMKATGNDTTKLSIRVGMFGDEDKSQQIYQKIYNNLHPIK